MAVLSPEQEILQQLLAQQENNLPEDVQSNGSVDSSSIMDKLLEYGMKAGEYLPGGGGLPRAITGLYNKAKTSMGYEPSHLPQNVQDSASINREYFDRFKSARDKISDFETIQSKLMESSTGSIDSLIIADDEKSWDAWAAKSPENFTKVQNIRMFPSQVIDGQVRYQIPIRNDDGSIDPSWRSMQIAMEDYDRIYERTALSRP